MLICYFCQRGYDLIMFVYLLAFMITAKIMNNSVLVYNVVGLDHKKKQ